MLTGKTLDSIEFRATYYAIFYIGIFFLCREILLFLWVSR